MTDQRPLISPTSNAPHTPDAVRTALLVLFIVGAAYVLGCSHADPLGPPPAGATFTPVKDNTLYENPLGQLSNGSGQYFFAGRTAVAGLIRRGLLAFDLTSGLPQGATVTSVVLTLHVSRTLLSAQSVQLHNVLADWGEGASNSIILGGGMGAPSAPGDATWSHTFFDTSAWANPGGDFAAAPSATQSVGAIGFYTWSSAQMVADIQAWLDDPSTNFGSMVKGPEGPASTKRFDSRENPVAAFRPRLTVRFQPAP